MENERLEAAVRTYADALYRLAYTQLRSRADAEDVVQEVFLRYLRRAPVFASAEHERAWLMRVTVNRCRDLLRSPWVRRRDELPEDLPAEGADEASELLAAVLALPAKYRAPIHLYYYEGYAIREIADLLGCRPATVGTRLARGRHLLRQALTDEGEEETIHEKT